MKDSGKMNEIILFHFPVQASWTEAGLQCSIYHLCFHHFYTRFAHREGFTVSSTCWNVKAFFSLCLNQSPHFLYFGTGQAWGAAYLCRSIFSLKGSNCVLALFSNRTLRSKKRCMVQRRHADLHICGLVPGPLDSILLKAQNTVRQISWQGYDSLKKVHSTGNSSFC